MSEQTHEADEDRSLVIECPTRCADRGCTDHNLDTWRKSRKVPSGTSTQDALSLLEEHAAQFPKSGPYRLVEYSATRATSIVLGGHGHPGTGS